MPYAGALACVSWCCAHRWAGFLSDRSLTGGVGANAFAWESRGCLYRRFYIVLDYLLIGLHDDVVSSDNRDTFGQGRKAEQIIVQWLLGVLSLVFLVDAARRSDIQRFEPKAMATWFVLTILIFGALILSASMPDGVDLQYSGAAFLALALGYSATLGQSLLVDAIFPVWLSVSMVMWTRKYLPANPFVFLLGCGFLGLFFVYCAQVIVGAMVDAVLTGQPVLDFLLSEQTIWSLLLAGGEATLEGMIISILVAFSPTAVTLFDDDFYLKKTL